MAIICRRTIQKDLHDQDNHDGVITHLQPDILECEVKWVLESITTDKASGGDGIPVELFQILKDALKVLYTICQHIWKSQQWPQDWKRSVFIPIPKKGNAKKECSNYRTTALISHASKVMLKILQARLQQYVSRELPDVQTCSKWRLLSSCGAQAAHCGGFSCWGAQALGTQASVVEACRLSSCGSQA